MGPGGRHLTRMTRHTQSQFDASVVNSQAPLGATTRVKSSPNTSNMGPGGRHATRMTRHTQSQFDASMVNSQAPLGATTRVEGSPNTSNMGPGGRHAIRMTRHTQSQFDASVVNSQAPQGATTRVEGSPNTSNMGPVGTHATRLARHTQAQFDASLVNSQGPLGATTPVEGSPNTSNLTPRVGHVPRVMCTQAQADSNIINSQALADGRTHFEGSPNTTDLTPRVGHLPRMTRNTQARANSSNSQTLDDARIHVEGSPNTTESPPVGRVRRMVRNTQARANVNTVNCQAPSDVATHLEDSSNTTDSVEKNVRKKTRNDFLKKYIETTGIKPRIEIKKGMMQPVGTWSQSYVNEIGIIVRMHAPLHIQDWRKLSIKDKRTIFHPHILEKFDIDLHVNHVEKAVHKYLGIRFRDYRSTLHGYYMDLGRDAQYKRSRPYSGVSQQNWETLCERFESEAYKKLSGKNSDNRALQEVNHCAGTVSFVRFREKMRNPETQEEMGRIDLYHETHFSEKKKDWVAPAAQDRYDDMVERQSQAIQEDSIPPTEDEICVDVLDKRPGYICGLGHGVMSCSSRQDDPSVEEIRRNNEETNRRLEDAERRADDAEMRRDGLSIEMVNQARKIEELENWKARLEVFMSSFGPAFPSGLNG